MYLNLFITGFDKNTTTEDQIRSHFSNFGVISSIRFNNNGSAFVCFNDRESARKAKENASFVPFFGKFLKVHYF